MYRHDERHENFGIQPYRDKVAQDFENVNALLTKFFTNNRIPREKYRMAKHFREQYGKENATGILACLGLKNDTIITLKDNTAFYVVLGQEKQMYQYPVEIKTRPESYPTTYHAYIDTILSIAEQFVD